MSELNAKLRSLPARIFKNMNRKMPASPLKSAPRDPREWIKFAREQFDLLPMQTQKLLDHHELVPDSHAVVFFKDYIEKEGGAVLERLAADPKPVAIAQAIDEIIRWLTVAQCAHAHQQGLYFAHAEPYMAQQWEGIIWPI